MGLHTLWPRNYFPALHLCFFCVFAGGGPFLRCPQKWGFSRGPFHAKTAFIHEGEVSPRRAMLSAGLRVLRSFVSQANFLIKNCGYLAAGTGPAATAPAPAGARIFR